MLSGLVALQVRQTLKNQNWLVATILEILFCPMPNQLASHILEESGVIIKMGRTLWTVVAIQEILLVLQKPKSELEDWLPVSMAALIIVILLLLLM